MIHQHGYSIVLLAIVQDAAHWQRITGRRPTKRDLARMDGISTYCEARWEDDDQSFIVDVATLRATDGYKEIADAVAKLAAKLPAQGKEPRS